MTDEGVTHVARRPGRNVPMARESLRPRPGEREW